MSAITSQDKWVEILVQQKKVSQKEYERIVKAQQKSGKSFFQVLVDERIMDEKEIVRWLSEVMDVPVFHLRAYQIDPEVIKLLPQKMAERYEAIPVARAGSFLTLATPKPIDLVALDDIEEITGCKIRLVFSAPSEIHDALATYYAGTAVLNEFLQGAGSEKVEFIAEKEETLSREAVIQAPIVRMVDRIIQEAVQLRASDIHLEPYDNHFRIRYRIDGVLKETFHHSLDIYPAVVARIKILSSSDITEKRIPQDGRFKVRLEDQEIDFRVSVLPTFFGQKVVLRLLDKANVRCGLDELGFSEKPIQLFKEAIRRPYGMILVTGPTGSGKSTTLYSVLNLLNTPERNLMTIEDPIEYQIEGITQTQVNPEIGLTFANGLRSLLRQSPDVILVGEIRDSETADIAVKAALTGHLVLSTLHTNSAAGAVTRLTDMGVEPFLIASSVILVAGQRLLRRICPHCKAPYPVPEEVLKRVSLSELDLKGKTSVKGKGCQSCNETGYLGRLGAIEVLAVDSEIRGAVLAHASSEAIERLARKKGMETLFENATGLFKTGKTTLEEVLRVTRASAE